MINLVFKILGLTRLRMKKHFKNISLIYFIIVIFIVLRTDFFIFTTEQYIDTLGGIKNLAFGNLIHATIFCNLSKYLPVRFPPFIIGTFAFNTKVIAFLDYDLVRNFFLTGR